MSIEIAVRKIKLVKELKSPILNLSFLDLEEIPREIEELTWLSHLHLENNNFKDLKCLQTLKNLMFLNLENNKIKEIPSFIFDLQSLVSFEKIDMNRYVLIKLSQIICDSLDLAKFLDHNQIPYFAFDQAQNLYLSIDQVQSCILDQEQNHDLDQTLDHARTRVRSLTQALDPNSQNENEAQDIAKDIARVLTRFIFQAQLQNDFGYYDRFQVLPQTQELALDLNQVLDKNINQAISIALELHKSVCFYRLQINGNKLSPPPPEIIRKGNVFIKIYYNNIFNKSKSMIFDETSDENSILNEVKVILVGEGASGKTSLVKCIIGEKFNSEESQTHGIHIIKQKFTRENQDFQVNFWDFGGQEIMHATHQFFLTKRCLYLLVLDSRKDEKAEYWLRYIQTYGCDAPVIIVLNKTDENPSFDVNRGFLQKKYHNIKAYYKTSCSTNKGIKEFKEHLMHQLWDLELRKTAYPKNWTKIKFELENMKEDYINYEKYRNICKKNKVSDTSSQKVLLELLNDLGVVLNYEKMRLHDTNILNPLWLTNAVYRIINSPILVQTKGELCINDIDTIINDPRYYKENPEHWTNIFKFWKPEQKILEFPTDKFLFLIDTMKQFELLFQIDDTRYFVPALLPEQENIIPLDSSKITLHFIIEFLDFIPAGIFPRLMVQLHKYIYKHKIWKTGMMIEEKAIFKNIAIIMLDKECKQINIIINGNRNRDFLTFIRGTIKEIISSYSLVKYVEWIPLPMQNKNEKYLIDYAELLGYEECKQTNYFSGKLKRTFLVSDLLNGVEDPRIRSNKKGIKIFISYSNKDIEFKEALKCHLIPLVRLNKATLWDDRGIDAGEDWNPDIFNHLSNSDIVLCLISSNFISSDFCYTEELKKALEEREQGNKIVIPIKVREVNWESLPIAKLQSLNKKWINYVDNDIGWTEVSIELEKVINKIQAIKNN